MVEIGVAPKSINSPRKRRFLQQRNKANPNSTSVLPITIETHLDVEGLFSGDAFDPEEALSRALDKFSPEAVEKELVASAAARQTERAEFDPETFTLKCVVKKLKEGSAAEGGEDERPADSIDLGVVARRRGVASSGRIEVERKEEISGSEEGPDFKLPKLRNRKFIFKPYVRKNGSVSLNESEPPVSVVIPEQLAASYGLYIWPSSPLLSWYVWLRREDFVGKQILELGAGTSLPGLLCAKIGAAQVFLSDIATDDNVLENCRQAVNINDLSDRVQVVGVTWGMVGTDTFKLCEKLDYVIGSDLFFDPSVFEQLCVTISFVLNVNPGVEVLITVQERSEDWSIEECLLKWGLRGHVIHTREFLCGTGIHEDDVTGGNPPHSIYILKVSLRN